MSRKTRTLKKLSNRQLDRLQDRISQAYWKATDCFPGRPNKAKSSRCRAMLNKIGNERLRRLGL